MSTIHEQTAPVSLDASVENIGVRNQELLVHRDAAYLLAYRIAGNWADAEDILQDAYVHAVRAQTPLLSGLALRKWFLQITANAAANFGRSDDRRRNRERSVAMLQEDRGTPPDARAEQLDLQRVVEAEFARLDEKFRAPISLHFEHGYSYDEAAEILNVPAGSLRSYASQGLKLLRERLDKPARPISAELLAGFLAVGIAAKASPTLATAVERIVASGGSATKAAVPAMKIFTAGSASGLSAIAKIAIAFVLFAMLSVGIVASVGWLSKQNPAPTPLTPASTTSDSADNAPELGIQKPSPIVNPIAPLPPPQNIPPPIIPAVAPLPKAASYQPPPDVEAQWAGAVELLAPIDNARDTVAGKWKFDGANLRIENSNQPWSRIAFPYHPPEEYDYRIDFTRTGGNPNLIQIFSVKNVNLAFQMGLAGGSRHQFGIKKDDPNAVTGGTLRIGARCTAIIEVRRDKISAYLNGHLMQRVAPRTDLADSGPDWRLPDQDKLGIGALFSSFVIHRIAVREVTGQGEFVKDDPVATAVCNEHYWDDARSLMPAAVTAGSVSRGKWAMDKGHLTVVADEWSRLQLNYKPPQEYDMRLVFTRTEGERQVSHTLVAGGHQFNWKIGAWSVMTLDYAGKWFLDSPASLHVPGHLENNKLHSSIVSIRKDRIRAYLDGKLVLDLATDYSDLQIENGWRLKSPESLGIGVNSSTVTFQKVQIKEVTGVGAPIEGGGEVKPPNDAF